MNLLECFFRMDILIFGVMRNQDHFGAILIFGYNDINYLPMGK